MSRNYEDKVHKSRAGFHEDQILSNKVTLDYMKTKSLKYPALTYEMKRDRVLIIH